MQDVAEVPGLQAVGVQQDVFVLNCLLNFFFSSRRRHTRCGRDWSSDVCSSDLAFDIAVIVVGPYQGDVFGQLHAHIVKFKNLFISGEGLRNLSRVGMDVGGEQLALLVDDVFKCGKLFFSTSGTHHARIVYTTHAQGVNTFVAFTLRHSFVPVRQNCVAVTEEVEVAIPSVVPFAHIVP